LSSETPLDDSLLEFLETCFFFKRSIEFVALRLSSNGSTANSSLTARDATTTCGDGGCTLSAASWPCGRVSFLTRCPYSQLLYGQLLMFFPGGALVTKHVV
jgi:hypothetical protein